MHATPCLKPHDSRSRGSAPVLDTGVERIATTTATQSESALARFETDVQECLNEFGCGAEFDAALARWRRAELPRARRDSVFAVIAVDEKVRRVLAAFEALTIAVDASWQQYAELCRRRREAILQVEARVVYAIERITSDESRCRPVVQPHASESAAPRPGFHMSTVRASTTQSGRSSLDQTPSTYEREFV